jgi:hypothetical protein
MFLCPKKLLMGLLFMLLASSVAFQAVRSVLGGWIATAEGLPKVGGLFVHALVFMVLSTMIWRYAPFGASNFEGMDDEEFVIRKMFGRSSKSGGFYKAAKRAVKEAEAYEDEPEEYRVRRCHRYNTDTGKRTEVSCPSYKLGKMIGCCTSSYEDEPEEYLTLEGAEL